MFGAGLPQLVGVVGEAKSYAERLFEFPAVGALEEASAREAIAAPLLRSDVGIDGDALAFIVKTTMGYPYFLQEWGFQAWKVANESPLTLEVAERATARARRALDSGFFPVRLERLTLREKIYMRAMAELGAGPHRSADRPGARVGCDDGGAAPDRADQERHELEPAVRGHGVHGPDVRRVHAASFQAWTPGGVASGRGQGQAQEQATRRRGSPRSRVLRDLRPRRPSVPRQADGRWPATRRTEPARLPWQRRTLPSCSYRRRPRIRAPPPMRTLRLHCAASAEQLAHIAPNEMLADVRMHRRRLMVSHACGTGHVRETRRCREAVPCHERRRRLLRVRAWKGRRRRASLSPADCRRPQ